MSLRDAARAVVELHDAPRERKPGCSCDGRGEVYTGGVPEYAPCPECEDWNLTREDDAIDALRAALGKDDGVVVEPDGWVSRRDEYRCGHMDEYVVKALLEATGSEPGTRLRITVEPED